MTPRKKTTAGEDAAGVVRAARAKRKASKASELITAGVLTFRAFLTSPDYFPTPPDLSPAMLAIVDGADGRPDLVTADLSRAIFNCEPSALPTSPPRVVGIGSGRRSGKTSNLLAPKAVHLAISVPLPNLKPGEVARVAIVAPDMDAAAACLNYVKGIVASSEVLRACVVGDTPAEDPEDVGTTIAVLLRRPDGKLVDIVVRAASRGGKSVRSRTLCGLVLDEACFLFADDGHSVNDRAIFDAAKFAVEPGGQIWIASTPWIEGEGLLEQLVTDNWTNGTQGKTALVAARVSTRVLRPGWDPDGTMEREMRAGPDGDITADREILAIPLPAGSRCYFPPTDVDAALSLPAPELSPQAIAAGVDLGHVSDRSALAVAARYPGGFFGVSLVIGIPSTPDRRPSETYRDFAIAAKLRGARVIASDGHYREAAREEYERHGMSFALAGPTDRLFEAGRTVMRERRLALADLPESDRVLLKRQMSVVTIIPRPGGGTKIHVPRTSTKDAAAGKGTTHCDELVAVLSALYEVGADEPELWAHEAERRAESDAAAAQGAAYVPPAGSLASLSRYRAGGKVSAGKFW